MSIIYPLALPAAPSPDSVKLRMLRTIGAAQSPFDLSQQIYDWGGRAWSASLSWSKIVTRAKASKIQALLTALDDAAATILVGDPLGKAPQGTALGVPVCNGAQAAGIRQLVTRGWNATQPSLLMPGDYIQVGGGAQPTRLHIVKGSTDGSGQLVAHQSDGSGDATLNIWPPLREALIDGAPLVTANCVGTFRRAAPADEIDETTPFFYACDLELIEAI